jgi:LDH2 family malate/lactate/ureidoglycolate dehydrogenase
MMFECLTSVMANNPLLEPALTGKVQKGRHNQNSVVAAIDIGTFTDVERYKTRIDELIDALKALPKAKGVDEIFVPGEPEARRHAERTKHGVPLPHGTVSKLREIAKRFNVDLPDGLNHGG